MRVRQVEISAELIAMYLTQGLEHPRATVTQGLPDGAKLIAAWFQGERDVNGRKTNWPPTLFLAFEHDSFDEVKPETLPPFHAIAIKREEPPAVEACEGFIPDFSKLTLVQRQRLRESLASLPDDLQTGG